MSPLVPDISVELAEASALHSRLRYSAGTHLLMLPAVVKSPVWMSEPLLEPKPEERAVKG